MGSDEQIILARRSRNEGGHQWDAHPFGFDVGFDACPYWTILEPGGDTLAVTVLDAECRD